MENKLLNIENLTYYEKNKNKFKDYYLSKREEKIEYQRKYNHQQSLKKMKEKLINCEICINPPNVNKKKNTGVFIKHGCFIVTFD